MMRRAEMLLDCSKGPVIMLGTKDGYDEENTEMDSQMPLQNCTLHINSLVQQFDDDPSSPETYDEPLMGSSMQDDVTAQLASSGTVGMAAAAAIATARKRKRNFSFETNPSIRKRQQTRLLRKLKVLLDEYITRVGQQAALVVCVPAKSNQNVIFKTFGAQPLENVIKNHKNTIMAELENALQEQIPPSASDKGGNQHELPPVAVDGIPTPVDKMTQSQLRAFIPVMLKYATGRGKPGWGRPEYRPVWWPKEVPWANVRCDIRTEDEKKRLSWTDALRSIVKNCYKYYGRDDLLPKFEEPISVQVTASQFTPMTISNPDGTFALIQVDASELGNTLVQFPDGTRAHIQAVSIRSTGDHNSNDVMANLASVYSTSSPVVLNESDLTDKSMHRSDQMSPSGSRGDQMSPTHHSQVLPVHYLVLQNRSQDGQRLVGNIMLDVGDKDGNKDGQ